MEMRNRVVIAGFLALTVACSQSHEIAGASQAPAAEPEAAPAAMMEHPATPRKLIRTVDLNLIVADVERAAADAQRVAIAAGGYVGKSSSEHWSDQLHVRMTLRIPTAALDSALEEIRGLADRVASEHQQATDVTDKYVDLEAQIKNLELTEAELQSLLAESRAAGRKVDGIMAIYRELTEIRGKSEALQGQLNLLASQVAYSTVHLALEPDEVISPRTLETWQPLVVARDSFYTLIGVLRGLASFAIFGGIVLVPLSVLGGLGIWLFLRGWRRLRKAFPKVAPDRPNDTEV